jgi:hypothetical protein
VNHRRESNRAAAARPPQQAGADAGQDTAAGERPVVMVAASTPGREPKLAEVWEDVPGRSVVKVVYLSSRTSAQVARRRILGPPPAKTAGEADKAGAQLDAELLTRAEELGREAHTEGYPAAPGVHPQILDMVRDWPVGTGAARVFEAFTRGYAAAAERTAGFAVLAAEIAAQNATTAAAIAERNPAAADCARINADGAASAARNAAARGVEAAAARAAATRPAGPADGQELEQQ